MVKQHLHLKIGVTTRFGFNDKDLVCSTRESLLSKDEPWMWSFFPPSLPSPASSFPSPFFLAFLFLTSYFLSDCIFLRPTAPRVMCGLLDISYFQTSLQSLTTILSRKSWWGETHFPPPTGAPGCSSVVFYTLVPPLPAVWHQANCFISLVPQCSHLYNESNKITLLNWIFWGFSKWVGIKDWTENCP